MAQGGNQSYFKDRRLGSAKAKEYSLVSSFKLGYRNREDITNLPPGVLVVGSKNVLTNVSERIQVRKGYTLYGQASTTAGGVLATFDWQSRGNLEKHIRVGGLTTAGNDGVMQFPFTNPTTGAVTWKSILTGLTTTDYNFTTFWNDTEQLRVSLFVNGTSNIFEWSGAYAQVVSITANTITIDSDVGETGFYGSSNRHVIINGVDYTYTGVSGSTFTGVTPDPTAQGGNTPVAGDVVFQKVVTTANSSTTGLPSTFKNGLIATLNNQVFIGSKTNPKFYFSKFGTYTDYSYSTPRLPAEGGTGTLDDNLVAFKPQEDVMYISAGKDFWYQTGFTTSSDLTKQTFDIKLLKVNPGQGAQSQALVSKMKNKVVFISNEPTMDELGRVENILGTPQTRNLSDPIKLDFDSYDFTDGSSIYHRYFIYITVPQEGVVRVYNLATGNWEAPLTLPIARFSIIDGELYGHDYNILQSYKLFDGYDDNGHPFEATAKFSYQNAGNPSGLKYMNAFYVEGYIGSNTTLDLGIKYEIDGCATDTTYSLDGANTQFVCIRNNDASLGKSSLGKNPLGSTLTQQDPNGLPPKFRWIPTFPRQDYFEFQPSFSSNGLDNRFEILRFGGNVTMAASEVVQQKN